MNNSIVPVGDGHTEVSESDRQALIPTYIATRTDLFDAEQRNIAKALLRRPPGFARLLDDKYLRDLHRAMFRDVWKWAGMYRRVDTNIGVAHEHIQTDVRLLVDDTRFCLEHNTYSLDELAIRFHHRLVVIHPFANGNGRHGRIAADYLVGSLGGAQFSWGADMAGAPADVRAAYIASLRRADGGDLGDLIAFARS